MTKHLSNPNANPRKVSRKDRKRIHKASQVVHKTPIKKSGYATGRVSNSIKFMREHEQAKDKSASTFESMIKTFPTGIITTIDEKTGEAKEELTWENRKPAKRSSPLSGVKKANKDLIARSLQVIPGSYTHKEFDKSTGEWVDKVSKKSERNYEKYPDTCYAKADGKCLLDCTGEYVKQLGCVHKYDRETGEFWVAIGSKSSLHADN